MNCPDCGAETTETAESCPECGRSLAVPAGTVLVERYEIQTLLGSGGLGRVYRAHDRMLDEIVAVKVLHPEAARSPELSKRFRSEIKLARKVRHRNVCAIHEYGEHGPYRFVAMELVDGVDLHHLIRERGPLPPRDAFEVAIQVAKGLTAIHDAGVIHRDLKTPNIMQDGRGVVRLLDFGIAKLLTPTGTLAVTAVQRVVGTPEYMSPEQIRGDDLDERSDIYALGVVDLRDLHRGSAVPGQEPARHAPPPGQRAAAALRRGGDAAADEPRARAPKGPGEGPEGSACFRPRPARGASHLATRGLSGGVAHSSRPRSPRGGGHHGRASSRQANDRAAEAAAAPGSGNDAADSAAAAGGRRPRRRKASGAFRPSAGGGPTRPHAASRRDAP